VSRVDALADPLAVWHYDPIPAKLAAVREGRIRRLFINVPPRHLKSHLASVAFPAWSLGHDPSMQILCVSYAQDLGWRRDGGCAIASPPPAAVASAPRPEPLTELHSTRGYIVEAPALAAEWRPSENARLLLRVAAGQGRK
jgi:hypothetical protein